MIFFFNVNWFSNTLLFNLSYITNRLKKVYWSLQINYHFQQCATTWKNIFCFTGQLSFFIASGVNSSLSIWQLCRLNYSCLKAFSYKICILYMVLSLVSLYIFRWQLYVYDLLIYLNLVFAIKWCFNCKQ